MDIKKTLANIAGLAQMQDVSDPAELQAALQDIFEQSKETLRKAKEFDDNAGRFRCDSCRSCENGKDMYEFYDGRGIYLFSACEDCFPQKRKSFRDDIFEPAYTTFEIIEAEDY